MTENKNLALLKFALAYFAVLTIVYGIGLVFFTEKLIEMSGTAPFEPNWVRWAGGLLAGLGIGAALALRNPGNQDGFVVAAALGTLFIGLALLYQLLFDWNPDHSIPFTAVPCALNLSGSVLLWVGRAKAK
jgi:hypothetical protein